MFLKHMHVTILGYMRVFFTLFTRFGIRNLSFIMLTYRQVSCTAFTPAIDDMSAAEEKRLSDDNPLLLL